MNGTTEVDEQAFDRGRHGVYINKVCQVKEIRRCAISFAFLFQTIHYDNGIKDDQLLDGSFFTVDHSFQP